MKKYINKILFASVLVVFSSCYFLDVSDELAGNLTKEQVFNDPGMTRRWHRNIFTGIPDYSNIKVKDVSGDIGLKNPWAHMSDEIYMSKDNNAAYENQGGAHAGNCHFHRWNTMYTLIRQANIFLKNAHVIPENGLNVDYLDETELKQLKAQARFLRAYYYYLLFELYGPVPLMGDEILDPYAGIEELDLPRNSVDEVVEYVCSEMQSLVDEEGGLNDIETDENYLALPTKGAALAVIAKIRVLAASKLYNGGYEEALQLTNSDGKRLFPDYDPNKWSIAKDALQSFLTFAKGKYELYKEKNKDGSLNVEKSLYNLFMKYNDEIIWASSTTFFGSITGHSYDAYCTPYSERVTPQVNAGMMQELVDDFLMKDGKRKEDSDLYKETGFTKVSGEDIFNQWIDREPRFYQSVFYQGRKWQISNNPIYFYNGSTNGVSDAKVWTMTGYLLHKRTCKDLYNKSSNKKSQYRPSIIFRLADFYLLYAEALIETKSSSEEILKYINLVRERAGIPDLEASYPGIEDDYDALLEAVRRERRVELCIEGQRYFDVRRWMLAEQDGYRQGGDFYGMNMYGPKGDKQAFYERVRTETRKFEKKNYLYPIPLTQVQISRQMVQNPLW